MGSKKKKRKVDDASTDLGFNSNLPSASTAVPRNAILLRTLQGLLYFRHRSGNVPVDVKDLHSVYRDLLLFASLFLVRMMYSPYRNEKSGSGSFVDTYRSKEKNVI